MQPAAKKFKILSKQGNPCFFPPLPFGEGGRKRAIPFPLWRMRKKTIRSHATPPEPPISVDLGGHMVPEILANWGLNERTTPRAFLDVARPRQAIGQPGRRPQGGRWEEAAHRQGTSRLLSPM
eukprot:4476140-Pyramimonas_sp.AAC.1